MTNQTKKQIEAKFKKIKDLAYAEKKRKLEELNK